MRGGGLWLWENGGHVGSMVYGGGGFHASCWGGGFSLRLFGAESRSFGRWRREVVQLECGDEVEGEDVVLGKLWGVRFKRWNFEEGFVL